MIALSLPTFWFGLLAHLSVRADAGVAAGRRDREHRTAAGLLDRAVASRAADAVSWPSCWSRNGAATRAPTMLEILDQDYIRTARAKGLRQRRVLLNHALRAALVPLDHARRTAASACWSAARW